MDTEHHQAETEGSPAEATPRAEFHSPQQQPQPESIEKGSVTPQDPARSWRDRLPSAKGLFDFLLVIFTGALAWTAIQQWHALNDTLIETRKLATAANTQANAAVTAANAARSQSDASLKQAAAAIRTVEEAQVSNRLALDAVKLTREQVHSGQRAYLIVKNLRIESAGPLAVGSRMRLQWETTNRGQTPAQNLRTHYAFYIGPVGLDAAPPQGTEYVYSEGRALGPGETEESPDAPGVWLEGRAGRVLTAEDVRRLSNGEFLNVRLTVAYDTVFPAVPGQTTLCAFYEGSRFSLCGRSGTHIQ